jgi:hypothetical protein
MLLVARGHKQMSSILADQMSPYAGGGGWCGVSPNENSYAQSHGAQINFGDGPQRMFMNERCMNVSTVLYKEK